MKIVAVCGSPHKGSCYSVLKTIADNHPEIDYEAALQHRGTRRMLSVSLDLGHRLLDASMPAPVADYWAQDAGSRSLSQRVLGQLFQLKDCSHDAREPPWRSVYYHSMELKADRWRLISHTLLLPSVNEWTIVPLPKWLSWLYYVIRPVRLVYRAVRRSWRAPGN